MRDLLPPRVAAPAPPDAIAPFWYGTVYVDPDLGRPLNCYAWCDPELRLKTAVPTTSREVTHAAA